MAKVPDEAIRKLCASFLVNTTFKFTPYIRYQYCVALWKTNLTYPICVVSWHYQRKVLRRVFLETVSSPVFFIIMIIIVSIPENLALVF